MLSAEFEILFKRPAKELYDLQTDEFEMHNLAADPQHAAIKAKLAKQLDAWMQQQGDQGTATELKAPSRKAKGKEQ